MKGHEPGNYRAIEVKGMNNLSIPYIKRYFNHAGSVSDVKKLEESVIVVIILSFRSLNTIVVLLMLINTMVEL